MAGCQLDLVRAGRGHGAAAGVVVPQVLGQHLAQVVLVDNQQPAGELSAQGADESFAYGVISGCLRRVGENPDPFRGEHGVEGAGELGARSLIRNLTGAARWPRSIGRLRAACLVQALSGLAVMSAR